MRQGVQDKTKKSKELLIDKRDHDPDHGKYSQYHHNGGHIPALKYITFFAGFADLMRGGFFGFGVFIVSHASSFRAYFNGSKRGSY
jgi:hypothetical protein